MSNELLNQNEIDALVQEAHSPSEDDYLTEEERDTLAEIGNISMGSAATALSSLINKKVTITVPNVTVSTLAEIQKSYPIPCIIVNVEYVTGLQGSNLLVIKERDASVIGNLMIGTDENEIPDEVDELSLSALTEAMNVMMAQPPPLCQSCLGIGSVSHRRMHFGRILAIKLKSLTAIAYTQ